ncbi:MAG: autotransporter domain-containing protein, partial [Endomicrobium sp.]|nr:autotransporter domain-containing protein [Endomicrobium sp.]
YVENSTINIRNSELSINVSSGFGGAAYFLNSQAAIERASFNSNRSFLDGGALYVENSDIALDDSSFSGNFAGQNGGAIYVKSSLLRINGGSVFNSNLASGVPNDIYLDDGAKLILDSKGREIIFSGGIKSNASSTDIEITKFGAGSAVFGGESSLNALIDVLDGSLIVSQDAVFTANKTQVAPLARLFLYRGSVVNISTLTINENAVFETENISSFNAGELNINGILKIGVDTLQGTADLLNAQILNLNSSSSSISFAGNISKSSDTYNIIHADSINGTFKETSGHYGARTSWAVNQTANDITLDLVIKSYADISSDFHGNRANVIKIIDEIYDDSFNDYGDLWHNVISPMDAMDISDLQKTAGALSGAIYADLFSISLLNRSKEDLLQQIAVRGEESNMWTFVKGGLFSLKQDENLNGDLTDTSLGIAGGMDLYNDYVGMAAGIFIDYDYHSAEQDKSDAKIHDIKGGFYGDLLWEHFEIKGFLAAGVLQYGVTRSIPLLSQKLESSFAAYEVRACVQAAALIPLWGNVSFKPFAGADGSYIKTPSFSETGYGAQLHFESCDFIASSAGGGLGLNGAGETFSWFISGGADFILSGSENKIKPSFSEKKDAAFEIAPSKQGELAIKASAGVEAVINEQISIFVNAGYVSGDNYTDIKANVGISYMIDYGFGL